MLAIQSDISTWYGGRNPAYVHDLSSRLSSGRLYSVEQENAWLESIAKDSDYEPIKNL